MEQLSEGSMAESEEYNVVPTRSIHPRGRVRVPQAKSRAVDGGVMMEEQLVGYRALELQERIWTKLRQMEVAVEECINPETK